MGLSKAAAMSTGLAMLLVVLSGCAESGPIVVSEANEPPAVESTSTTGGIRGVVVDSSIVPVEGATVVVIQTGDTTTTDVGGAFAISGLEPGSYLVEATHHFYDTVQQTAIVEAGVDNPPALKMQLTRQVFATPYMDTIHIAGYIYCSANIVGAYSEECGEGVGYPCDYIPPDPTGTYPCGYRFLKNENNQAGTEWYVAGPGAQHMTIEQVWEPSLEVSASGGGSFRTFISVNWVCDPWCGDDHRFGTMVGNSPLWGQITSEQLAEAAEDTQVLENYGGVNPTTRFTTFTYAADNPGLLLEQPYEAFISTSYWLSPPEGWSFVNGDPNPF